VAVALAALGVVAVVTFVDLSPRVQGDFFFAADDPQMQASREVAEVFPAGAQLILRVADQGGDPDAYREGIVGLTNALLALEGVDSGFSITTDEPSNSPLFGRILLTPDPDATNIVLQVDQTDPELLLPRVEAVVEQHESDALDIVVSGVPAIVELIRRSLYRDLIVFSVAAVLVFALLIGIVYRDPAIVVGTLATCLVSVSVTLLIVQTLGVGIGLLTANLVTIVFVLTLSHVVFLTANWRRAAGEDRSAMILEALGETWEGSFWSMTTTLLGFASLLIATAQPLRELGVAGIVGTVTALTMAYLVYPSVLGRWARVQPPAAEEARTGELGARPAVLGGAVVVVGLLAVGVPQLDTDPGLLSYFAPGSELREGLALVDADGGSSTLDIVVSDAGGASVASREVYPRLDALQDALEADAAVGVVLSPTLLIDHARTIPLAGLLPVGMLFDLASSDALGGVALGFVTADRDQARFSLRMRETVNEPRELVMTRLTEQVEATGLRADVVAGLYDLQAQLGRLIASSLKIGIGGLMVLFLGVALIVARSGVIAGAMWVCLGAIPLVILGTFGHARIAIDIITSPAANIALAIGADSMIHLVIRVRRLAAAGAGTPWASAVAQIGRPVLGASAIICAGFGIFALSSFPPTQRFGLAVIVGTMAAATMALLVLPRLATTIKNT
jgi:predicted RND superfamily exporter protein